MNNTSQPFVSFIIPSKNEESNIEKCLRSIINLDYPKDRYEIIVADGNSEDATVEIASALGAKVISNHKIIQSAGRNLGAIYAKGELIAFIDADIILGSQWLEKVVMHFADPNVAAVGNFPGTADEADWIEKVWFFHTKSKYAGRNPFYVDWLASANIIFVKRVFNEIGGFDESIKYTEDIDIGLRTTRNGYKMILDTNLESIHLDYAKSLTGFAKRQLAGGRAIIQLIAKYGFKKNWRISLYICCYLTFIIVFLFGIFLSLRLSIFSIFLMLILAAALAFQRCYNAKCYSYFFQLSFLLFLSGIMRAVAIVLPNKR